MADYRRLHELHDIDHNTLTGVKAMIDKLSAINHKMPISYARVFIQVALNPGSGPTDYADHLDMDQPSVSRILKELSGKARHRKEAAELVEHVVSAESGRDKEYYLTRAGMTLMYDLIRAVR